MPAANPASITASTAFSSGICRRGCIQRALIILVAPMVLLQTIMTGLILDRHWDNVTKVLARSLAREIGLVTDLYDQLGQDRRGPRADRDDWPTSG